MRDSHIRSFVKGVSWRTLGTIDTILLSFLVTGNVGHSLQIGLTEVITKIILYYVHERLWNIISWGRVHGKGPTHGRSLMKGISWRVLGTLDTIFLAYIITGVPINAITIGSFEVLTKIGLYYLHERLWGKILWERVMDDTLDVKLNELKVSNK